MALAAGTRLVRGKPNEHPGLCWGRGDWCCWGPPLRSPWQSIPGGWQGAGATVPEQGTQVASGSGDGGVGPRAGDGWGSAGGSAGGRFRWAPASAG